MKRALAKLARVACRAAGLRLQSWGKFLFQQAALSQAEAIKATMRAYDMVADADEQYYARQYLHWLFSDLDQEIGRRDLRVLDLGCGQGRLTLPLAEWCGPEGGTVEGVDMVPEALNRAREYVAKRRIRNVSFTLDDLLAHAQSLPSASVDVVLFIEVAFIFPAFQEPLKEVVRALRVGGLLFAAFRPQYYNLLYTVRQHWWTGAEVVLRERQGQPFQDTKTFTWQSATEIRQLLEGLGLRVLSLKGIGVSSGIPRDPLVSIARPSLLSPSEQDRLMAIECAMAVEYADCGRYILATARK